MGIARRVALGTLVGLAVLALPSSGVFPGVLPYTGKSLERPGWTMRAGGLQVDTSPCYDDNGEIIVCPEVTYMSYVYHTSFLPKELFNTTWHTDTTNMTTYPGRPEGICTSTGLACDALIEMQDQGVPAHIADPNGCSKGRSKMVRDVFGRPMTIRFMYNGPSGSELLVKPREQVCSIASTTNVRMASNRSLEAEIIDDLIWKNLTIWALRDESKWSSAKQVIRYTMCHALYAQWQCSSMFPNCTAEQEDRKPALPCRELCQEMKRVCRWSLKTNFLPFSPNCEQYPSAFDPFKKCTIVPVTESYMARVAGAGKYHASLVALAAVLFATWITSA